MQQSLKPEKSRSTSAAKRKKKASEIRVLPARAVFNWVSKVMNYFGFSFKLRFEIWLNSLISSLFGFGFTTLN